MRAGEKIDPGKEMVCGMKTGSSWAKRCGQGSKEEVGRGVRLDVAPLYSRIFEFKQLENYWSKELFKLGLFSESP